MLARFRWSWSGGISVRFSRVVKLSVVFTRYARTGMMHSARMKNFMRRSKALRRASIIIGYLENAKLKLAKMDSKVEIKSAVVNE